MANCPRCSSPAKLTGKEWQYGRFHVKQHTCSGCKKKFMEYYKDGKLSHVIPKDTRPPIRYRRKVLAYLKKNQTVSIDQLAKDLKLSVPQVLKVFSAMEDAGEAEEIKD